MRVATGTAIVAFALMAACAGPASRPDVSQQSGKEIYGQLCTSCHGASAKGNGPMASLLKVDVPDLTRIAQRHHGEFPAEQVRQTIDGRFERPAHGLPYMPVWGLQFYDPKNPQDAQGHARGDLIIDKLVAYLRSIQEE